MNKYIYLAKYTLLSVLIFSFIVTGSVIASDHDYQVTGPVLSITDTAITVQKDKSHWMISKNANTHTIGNIKVGDKVAIKYHMVADHIVPKSFREETKPLKEKLVTKPTKEKSNKAGKEK